jgi:hypothetical protein
VRGTRTITIAALAIILIATVGVASASRLAPPRHYCGSRFVLHERYGIGASDFDVSRISCQGAKRVADGWFHATFRAHRQPRIYRRWTFRAGYVVTAARGAQQFKFDVFGID